MGCACEDAAGLASLRSWCSLYGSHTLSRQLREGFSCGGVARFKSVALFFFWRYSWADVGTAERFLIQSIDQGHRAGARDLPVQNRMIRPLWCTDLFATVAECAHGRQAGRGDRWTTKHTKSTKLSEKEAFDAILQFRPEVPVNRDRTTAHSIRQNVEFHLRDLRGCSNGVQWSTP